MLQTATKKILVVTKEVELRIARDYEPRINLAGRLYSSDELINVSKGADALLITGQDRMHADVISRLPGSVRVIATLSVGFDHIDLIAAANRGILVTNTPEVVTDATADSLMWRTWRSCLKMVLGTTRRSCSSRCEGDMGFIED